MAGSTFSALSLVGSIASSDRFGVVQSGSSFAATAEQIRIYVDKWTCLSVSAAHFSVSTTTPTNITGLAFTPGTNSTYEFEACLMLKTNSTSITPRIALAWPVSTTSVGWINLAQGVNTQLMGFGNQTVTVSTGVGSLPNTTHPWPAIAGGIIRTFGGTSSSFRLQLFSESSGVFVSSMIGSYLKYKPL